MQKIYGGQLAIPAVVDMLASFRDSGNDKEQQVFSCMVHNLFDEYQFFTKYPDKVPTVCCACHASPPR